MGLAWYLGHLDMPSPLEALIPPQEIYAFQGTQNHPLSLNSSEYGKIKTGIIWITKLYLLQMHQP